MRDFTNGCFLADGIVIIDGAAKPSQVHVTNAVVKGFTFQNFATPFQTEAVLVGPNARLIDSVVQNNSTGGVHVSGNSVTLLRVTVQKNGQEGIAGGLSSHILIKDCISANNNYGMKSVGWSCVAGSANCHAIQKNGLWYANPGFESGGGKFSQCNDVTFDHHEAFGNTGPGLWADYNNSNFVITNSSFHNNLGLQQNYEGPGLAIEISGGPVSIDSNTFANNSGSGVGIWESANVTINNNVFNPAYIEFRCIAGRAPGVSADIVKNNSFTGTNSKVYLCANPAGVTQSGNTFK